ncbi:tensin [Clonorchis sinensis]|uniref:Tensin n=1 Tax=Clonorchis sinensis TaxID=79923 RepID=G7YTS0_CLOSI|nr:tensin [Clonorchis sinensis]
MPTQIDPNQPLFGQNKGLENNRLIVSVSTNLAGIIIQCTALTEMERKTSISTFNGRRHVNLSDNEKYDSSERETDDSVKIPIRHLSSKSSKVMKKTTESSETPIRSRSGSSERTTSSIRKQNCHDSHCSYCFPQGASRHFHGHQFFHRADTPEDSEAVTSLSKNPSSPQAMAAVADHFTSISSRSTPHSELFTQMEPLFPQYAELHEGPKPLKAVVDEVKSSGPGKNNGHSLEVHFAKPETIIKCETRPPGWGRRIVTAPTIEVTFAQPVHTSSNVTPGGTSGANGEEHMNGLQAAGIENVQLMKAEGQPNLPYVSPPEKRDVVRSEPSAESRLSPSGIRHTGRPPTVGSGRPDDALHSTTTSASNQPGRSGYSAHRERLRQERERELLMRQQQKRQLAASSTGLNEQLHQQNRQQQQYRSLSAVNTPSVSEAVEEIETVVLQFIGRGVQDVDSRVGSMTTLPRGRGGSMTDGISVYVDDRFVIGLGRRTQSAFVQILFHRSRLICIPDELAEKVELLQHVLRSDNSPDCLIVKRLRISDEEAQVAVPKGSVYPDTFYTAQCALMYCHVASQLIRFQISYNRDVHCWCALMRRNLNSSLGVEQLQQFSHTVTSAYFTYVYTCQSTATTDMSHACMPLSVNTNQMFLSETGLPGENNYISMRSYFSVPLHQSNMVGTEKPAPNGTLRTSDADVSVSRLPVAKPLGQSPTSDSRVGQCRYSQNGVTPALCSLARLTNPLEVDVSLTDTKPVARSQMQKFIPRVMSRGDDTKVGREIAGVSPVTVHSEQAAPLQEIEKHEDMKALQLAPRSSLESTENEDLGLQNVDSSQRGGLAKRGYSSTQGVQETSLITNWKILLVVACCDMDRSFKVSSLDGPVERTRTHELLRHAVRSRVTHVCKVPRKLYQHWEHRSQPKFSSQTTETAEVYHVFEEIYFILDAWMSVRGSIQHILSHDDSLLQTSKYLQRAYVIDKLVNLNISLMDWSVSSKTSSIKQTSKRPLFKLCISGVLNEWHPYNVCQIVTENSRFLARNNSNSDLVKPMPMHQSQTMISPSPQPLQASRFNTSATLVNHSQATVLLNGSRGHLSPTNSTAAPTTTTPVITNGWKVDGSFKQPFIDRGQDNGNLGIVQDTAPSWYRPKLSREAAINILRQQPPGNFLIRDSTTFKGAYGLAVKVATLPPKVTQKSGFTKFVRSLLNDLQSELVRHYLIEVVNTPTRGVRLKGFASEPVFPSLAALIHQHTIDPLALPCRLILPPVPTNLPSSGSATLPPLVIGTVKHASAVEDGAMPDNVTVASSGSVRGAPSSEVGSLHTDGPVGPPHRMDGIAQMPIQVHDNPVPSHNVPYVCVVREGSSPQRRSPLDITGNQGLTSPFGVDTDRLGLFIKIQYA